MSSRSALIAILLLLLSTEAHAQIKVDCVDDDKAREHIRMLILTGIDQALINQVTKLFDVWMRESSEKPPKRALTGADIATNAYLRARANALKWNPPLCEGTRP
jgi:hypothetical protein